MGCIFVFFMNKALISIGSNEDRENNLARCQALLASYFSDIRYSSTSVTSPYGSHYKNDFLNQLALVYTQLEEVSVYNILKQIEKEMGRSISDKEKGIVIIDIDLVIWNEKVLKPIDMERSYVRDLLSDLSSL